MVSFELTGVALIGSFYMVQHALRTHQVWVLLSALAIGVALEMGIRDPSVQWPGLRMLPRASEIHGVLYCMVMIYVSWALANRMFKREGVVAACGVIMLGFRLPYDTKAYFLAQDHHAAQPNGPMATLICGMAFAATVNKLEDVGCSRPTIAATVAGFLPVVAVVVGPVLGFLAETLGLLSLPAAAVAAFLCDFYAYRHCKTEVPPMDVQLFVPICIMNMHALWVTARLVDHYSTVEVASIAMITLGTSFMLSKFCSLPAEPLDAIQQVVAATTYRHKPTTAAYAVLAVLQPVFCATLAAMWGVDLYLAVFTSVLLWGIFALEKMGGAAVTKVLFRAELCMGEVGIMLVMVLSYIQLEDRTVRHTIVVALACVWYLFPMVMGINRYPRLEGIAPALFSLSAKGTAMYVQGACIWSLFANGAAASPWPMDFVGVMLVVLGLGLEAMAVKEKLKHLKSRPGDVAAPWVRTGVWQYARHPDCGGEVLAWSGLAILAAAGMPPRHIALCAVSPVFSLTLRLYVTIASRERRLALKYYKLPTYERYVANSSLLLPLGIAALRRQNWTPLVTPAPGSAPASPAPSAPGSPAPSAPPSPAPSAPATPR